MDILLLHYLSLPLYLSLKNIEHHYQVVHGIYNYMGISLCNIIVNCLIMRYYIYIDPSCLNLICNLDIKHDIFYIIV